MVVPVCYFRAIPMGGMAEGHDDKRRSFIQLAKLSSIGLEMGVAVALGWAIGRWLDGRFGTQPWLMLTFLLLGVAAGFKGVYAAAREAVQRTRDAKD